MRLIKNRLVIGCICIILAFALGFLGVPFLVDKMSDKVNVVVANQDIPKGTKLEEGMFRIIEVSQGDLPYVAADLYESITGKAASGNKGAAGSSSIFVKESSEAKYAAVQISKNDYVSRQKITSTIPYKDKELRELGENEYAVTISVSALDASVAGKVRAGDVITPMIISGNGNDTKANVYDEIRYMEIISVSNKDGADISSSNSESLPAVVTLKCNFDQAAMLAQLNSSHKIHLAFAAHAESERAAELLKTQADFFNSTNGGNGQ
ncbi:MAG: hypothetical protein IK990_12005 [Ruminiclostridium sp.]|nr:hypothetical protein [Ruminiclostridium sp.]